MDSDQENQATAESEENISSHNSESSADTQEDFSKLSVVDLKSRLKELDLPISGNKSDLVDRLLSFKSETDNEKVADQSIEISDAKSETSLLIPVEELENMSRSELRKIRKEYHSKAEELRKNRDELNLKSQTHASERNDLNVKAKEYMDEVHLYRDRRNGLNVEVGQIRDQRNAVADNVSSLKDNFLALKLSLIHI